MKAVDSALPESLPGIQIADALRRIGNRPALLFELLCELEQEQAGTFDQIGALLAEGRRQDATQRAHSIKGVALNLGCNTLADAAQALEAALKSDDADVAGRLAAASAAFAEVCSSVGVLRAQLQP